MIRAELKRLRGLDIIDLQNFSPEEADNFHLPIQAVIGPLGSKGEEAFDFVICTPKWIEREVQEKGPLFGKAHIIVNEYNYDQIFTLVDELCNRLSGDSWETIENKLRLYGGWEYEE
jgi:immunity protein 8 of polymorphic toxin system